MSQSLHDMKASQERYGIKPGDFIIDQEGERARFHSYSTTFDWGFFQYQHMSKPIKLPLEGLKKARRQSW